MTSHIRRKIASALRKIRAKTRRARKQFRIGRKELQADIRKRLHDYFYNPLSDEEEETPPPLPPRNPVARPLPPIPVDDDNDGDIIDEDDEIDLIPPPLPPRRPPPPPPSNPIALTRRRKVEDQPILPSLPTVPSSANLPVDVDFLRGPLAKRRAVIEASDDEDGEYTGFGVRNLSKLKRRKRRRNPLAGTPAMKAHMAWVRSFKRP